MGGGWCLVFRSHQKNIVTQLGKELFLLRALCVAGPVMDQAARFVYLRQNGRSYRNNAMVWVSFIKMTLLTYHRERTCHELFLLKLGGSIHSLLVTTVKSQQDGWSGSCRLGKRFHLVGPHGWQVPPPPTLIIRTDIMEPSRSARHSAMHFISTESSDPHGTLRGQRCHDP